ncbi:MULTISPECIES: hypothetical protein [unclassified Chelatococcus]|uniref:hypothetical protein n=1 Tax=unclassified Chelatococcus TaxID=2638111 RepID=UPI001BD14C10|nr:MULTISPECIES: hypothetical protein [unclassified Chelatococcus]MBS7696290.1 hypothetical protein [Chelatococcus sp. YT9]MBX3556899.1 hypothetical protein [Chelatococcus sp.]
MGAHTDEISQIALLIEIARRAIDVEWYEDERRQCQSDLRQAFQEWKDARRIDHVERDTPNWDALMEATAEPFAELERAKRHARNAKKRLTTAIRRMNTTGGRA